jgi:hypothetical protein
MTQRRLKYFGWGREGEEMTPEEEALALRTYRDLFGVRDFEAVPVPGLDVVDLRTPISALSSATIAPSMRSANPIRTRFSDYLTITAAHPMLLPTRATNRTSGT